MANHLDLEEQEQLDRFKHFWNQYGNVVSWLLILVFGAFASWNGYQWWSQRQAEQASAMYEEVDRVISSGDVVAADRAYGDMRQRFPSTVYTQHAGLALAKLAYLSDKPEVAQMALASVAESTADKGLAALARIRQAGLSMDAKQLDAASKVLDEKFPPAFAGLVADKKADMLVVQGKTDEAVALYKDAMKQLPERDPYRRLVEVKLAALGAGETK